MGNTTSVLWVLGWLFGWLFLFGFVYRFLIFHFTLFLNSLFSFLGVFSLHFGVFSLLELDKKENGVCAQTPVGRKQSKDITMNKNDIENATILTFGNNLVAGIDYDSINPNQQFQNYNNGLNSLNSKFFYLACNGGYEQEFNGDLSFQLHSSLNMLNNQDFVLRERTYTLPRNGNQFLVNAKGKAVYSSKVDIVSGNVANGLPGDSAIMLGHNLICQSSTIPTQLTNYPNFLQKVASELMNLSILGFQNNFFVALLSDIDIQNQIFGFEYKNAYLGFMNARNNNGYVTAINGYRNAFRRIDQDFKHLIFKTSGLIGYNADIYLNVFIIEKECNIVKEEKNGLYIVGVE